MTCPRCGTDRLDDRRFCPTCGHDYEAPASATKAAIGASRPGWWRRRSRRSKFGIVGLAAFVVIGFIGSPTEPPAADGLSLALEEGAPVATGSIRGHAPQNAEIVQDISLASDKRTTADADGNWVLTIDLHEGDNDITLRMGDDYSTVKTIRIVYDPTLAASAPSEDADARSTATAEPRTPRPTPKPPATGVVAIRGKRSESIG